MGRTSAVHGLEGAVWRVAEGHPEVPRGVPDLARREGREQPLGAPKPDPGCQPERSSGVLIVEVGGQIGLEVVAKDDARRKVDTRTPARAR